MKYWILFLFAFLVGCDDAKVYPDDIPVTVDVTQWYNTDSLLTGCHVYYMRGIEGKMKIKFGQAGDAGPSTLYFVKCPDGNSTVSTAGKSTNKVESK